MPYDPASRLVESLAQIPTEANVLRFLADKTAVLVNASGDPEATLTVGTCRGMASWMARASRLGCDIYHISNTCDRAIAAVVADLPAKAGKPEGGK